MRNDTLNQRHLLNPELGDYWHEMFCPILVVVDLYDNVVRCLEKKKAAGQGHWTWDVDKVSEYNKSEFAAKLRYGGDGDLANKTWCDVSPRGHKVFSDHVRAREPYGGRYAKFPPEI